MVIRASSIIPDMKSAFFSCNNCKNCMEIDVIGPVIAEPKTCDKCQSQYSMQIVHNRCKFLDKQIIKLQVCTNYTYNYMCSQSIYAHLLPL